MAEVAELEKAIVDPPRFTVKEYQPRAEVGILKPAERIELV